MDKRDPFGLGAANWGGVPQVNKQEVCWQETLPFEQLRRTRLYRRYVNEYINRRAFSEQELLEALAYEDFQEGCVYNFLTDGDVDSLSYLKAIVNRHALDECVIATWRMTAADWMTISHFVDEGRIGRLYMRLSSEYSKWYSVEWEMIADFYKAHTSRGNAKCIHSHAKIMAGANEAQGFYFTAQSSANINTNPCIENCCLQFDKGAYEFYRDFFLSR